jgi:hypothetical protein
MSSSREANVSEVKEAPGEGDGLAGAAVMSELEAQVYSVWVVGVPLVNASHLELEVQRNVASERD